VRDAAQPAAKAAAGAIAAEVVEAAPHLEKHLLAQVFGIAGLQARLATPVINQGAVEGDEAIPGFAVARDCPCQQAGGGSRFLYQGNAFICQDFFLRQRQNVTRQRKSY
jgi:hypothetical protein